MTRALTMSPGRVLALCAPLAALIGFLDYVTGYEMDVALLYLAPIGIAAWHAGSRGAVAMSLISMTAWVVSVVHMQQTYSHPLLHVWDGVIQLAMFLLFGLVMSRLNAALGHADERFATVLEGLNAAVYVCDAENGKVLYANEQFRKTFPEGRGACALPNDADEGEVHDAARGRWYLVHARPLRWIDGRRVRLQLATDITERRRAEALLRRQQEKIEMTARLVAVGETAATLAHELNQPLAAITNYSMGCVRRLRSGEWQEGELIEALEKGAAQAERASKVIQRLREFVARRAPQLAPCDINRVVSGVASMIGQEARRHGASLKLELGHAIPHVRADALLVEQVVLNLARNAIEAMRETPAAQREVTIRSCSQREDTVEVQVLDRGPGIDPELAANLFTPFFSTKSHGMGLGLHICRSIVEAHGGRVWVSRNGADGARFHFSLKAVCA